MRIHWRIVLVASLAGLVVAGPVGYTYYRNNNFRNFRIVEDDVLYRSGQLSPRAFEQVIQERQIRTVVSLRTTRVPGRLPPDSWEEAYCAAHGLKHIRIVPRVWCADEKGEIPAEQAVQEFLKVMDNRSNYPVLVHCFAGIHRTGTMCAIFRLEYHHWPVERAIHEMQQYGFDPADMEEHIDGYLRSYVPRWKLSPRLAK
jgi:tyrosine-protein phosphatase SIW14